MSEIIVNSLNNLAGTSPVVVSDIATSTDLVAPTGASLIGYTPTGLLTATTVEGALNEVRDASKVSYTPAGTGAVPTNVQAKLRESVSVLGFGANTVPGTTDMTTAFQTAFVDHDDVYLPDGDYLLGPITLTGKRLHGPGRIIASPACATAALLTLVGSKVDGITVHSPTYCLYGVLMTGDSDVADDVTFSGDFGHCVLGSGADKPSVIECTVKEGYSQTTPFVFDTCLSPSANGNNIEEHTGFGIQFRFCADGQANSNKIAQRFFSSDFATTATTQVFTLTTTRSCSRFAAYCNGVFLATSVVTVSPTQYSVTVSGLTIGQTTTIYGFVGLESIQFNSGCNGGTATGNVVKGSGDSAILLGADYHFNGTSWVLAPELAVKSDYPRNITITGNTVTGPCHAAGIALNNAVGCTVTGNTVSDVGYIYDNAYQCGVSLGLVHDCTINGNTTEGNTHTLACVKYTGCASTSNYSSYVEPSRFSNNKGYNGAKDYEFFATSSTTVRRVGFDVDGLVDDTITRAIDDMLASSWVSGNYTGNRLACGASGGSGLVKDNSVTYADYTSLRTVAGEYLDIGVPATVHNMFVGNICKVSFWAKSDTAGDTGYAQLYYTFPGDDAVPPFTVDITNTTWQLFSFEMAIGLVDGLFLRVGGSVGVVRISKLRIDCIKL